MYDEGLSNGMGGKKTFEDYQANKILKRSEISAFFGRMNAKHMTSIQN
jgi:hypothetical protein